MLSFVFAPAAVAGALTLLAWTVYRRTEVDPAVADRLTQTVAGHAFLGMYAMAAIGGTVAVLALWSLRWRSATVYAIAGLLIGLGAGALLYAASETTHSLVAHAAPPLLGAALMVTLRLIAGVRAV